jgi:hypothetical protein
MILRVPLALDRYFSTILNFFLFFRAILKYLKGILKERKWMMTVHFMQVLKVLEALQSLK